VERRPPVPLTLRQVDPIIRQLTLYRDLIDVAGVHDAHPEGLPGRDAEEAGPEGLRLNPERRARRGQERDEGRGCERPGGDPCLHVRCLQVGVSWCWS
jgi:hypothetical protein